MGHHVALQHGGGAEDLPARGAGVVLLGVHLVDVPAVVLQCGEAHPAFLAVVWILDVWFHGHPRGEREGKTPRAAVRKARQLGAVPVARLFGGQAGPHAPRTSSECGDRLTTPPPLSREGGDASEASVRTPSAAPSS